MAQATIDLPAWDELDQQGSLSRLKGYASGQAAASISWYTRKRKAYSRFARTLRVLLIVLIGAGGLLQLLDATMLVDSAQKSDLRLSSWSYVAFAIAAGLFAFDRFFGFSSGWIRFIMAELALKRLVVEFDYDFALLEASAQGESTAPSRVAAMLRRVKEFALQVESTVKQETDAWALEFRNSMAELEKLTRAELDKKAPGSVKVVVADAFKFKRVDVLLNGDHAFSLSGTTEGAIPGLPPGIYTIAVVAEAKDGNLSRASKVVEVKSGSMAAVDLKPVGQ